MRDITDVGWMELAAAIVAQAVQDRRSAEKALRRRPDDRDANGCICRIDRFLRSRWCALLADWNEADLKPILQTAREEIMK